MSVNVNNSTKKTDWLAKSGMLAAVSIIFMYFEASLPFMPGFLKFDLSEIPVLMAAFALGPFSAVAIELVKNIAHLPATHTMGVGELANFAVGCALTVPAGIIYKKNKTKSNAVIGLVTGTLFMTLAASVLNYYLMIPFYVKVIGLSMDKIVEMANIAGNKLVKDLKSLVVFAFVPFNLFKGIFVSIVVILIYKPLSPILHPKSYSRSRE